MKENDKVIFEGLNSAQADAVRQIEGSSLIIAGAGSGKTRVLTCRIANAIASGAAPREILALTFTKKAATEMKERIAALVGADKARWIWMGTFHSIFIRFLRKYSDLLGYPEQFTIYDQSDSRTAVKQCIKELQLDEKFYKPNDIASRISSAKNSLITAGNYINNPSFREQDEASKKGRIGDIYDLYAKKCKIAGAMDFDDILVNTNVLFRDFPDALEEIRSQFKYILVDEYQDTNYAQYIILKRLAMIHRNICVVGDDSQSIYAFRGARVENILKFNKDYPETHIFRLEENYRSTQTIVNAANSLIAKNEHRLEKVCFSQQSQGDKIEVLNGFTEQEESYLVASKIIDKIYESKAAYSDFAILYRTNAQSRSIEEALRKRNLPYRVYAGFSFFDRAEVKDMLAYFRLVINPKDDEAFRRVVNFPTRGIGETSLNYLRDCATSKACSLLDTISLPDNVLASFGLKNAAISKLRDFAAMIMEVHNTMEESDAYNVAVEIGNRSGALLNLKADSSIEGLSKFQNVESLFNSIKDYVDDEKENRIADGADENMIVTLSEYVENITLLSSVEKDSGEEEDDNNKISLMTIHASKGLEFSYVFIIGLEENLFPAANDVFSLSEIEEERRLFYVALTRAEKAVTLSYASNRMRWGKSESNAPSRFLNDIDKQYLSGALPTLSGSRAASNSAMGEAFARQFNGGYSNYGNSYQSRSGQAFRSNPQPAPRPQQTPQPSPRPQASMPTANHTPSADFSQAAVADLKIGQKVEHDRFGFGIIEAFEGEAAGLKAKVNFENGGSKTLLLKFAKLSIVR